MSKDDKQIDPSSKPEELDETDLSDVAGGTPIVSNQLNKVSGGTYGSTNCTPTAGCPGSSIK
jgi:hypothetical protein